MVKTNLITEYLNILKKYRKQYGEKTIVMMEVGSFYELYAITDDELNALKEACLIMGIRITRKNNKSGKEIIDSGNPYMAGVTSIAFTKYMKLLLNNNFTIVKIDQITPPPNPKREVTRIYSPGTYWEENTKKDNCHIISLYIEGFDIENSESKRYIVGVYILDLSTGYNYITEYHDKKNYTKLGALTDLYKLIYSYDANEIIFSHTNAMELEDIITDKLNIQTEHFHNLGELDSKYTNIPYQDTFLNKYYPCSCNISTVDFLGISNHPYSLISLIIGLEFAYDHSSKLISFLPKPKMIHNNDGLYISYQTLEKLDIINNNNKSLYNILNICGSSPGRRLLKKILLNPIINKEELEKRYNDIEVIIPHYHLFEEKIKYAYDIDRLHRKVLVNTIKPYEFYILHQTYEIIHFIINTLKQKNLKQIIIPNSDISKINQFVDIGKMYKKTINLEIIGKYNNFSDIQENIFNNGECQPIDNLISNKTKYKIEIDNFKKIIALISQNKKEPFGDFFINKQFNTYDPKLLDIFKKKYSNLFSHTDHIKIDSNEKEGLYFKMTKTRFRDFKKNLLQKDKLKYFVSDKHLLELDRIIFKEKTSEVTINSPLITNNSNEISNIHNLISDTTKKIFNIKLDEWFKNKLDIIQWSNYFLANMDVIVSKAKLSKLYNYCKPSIKKGSRSGINGKNIRHVIIERLNNKNIFTPNDINIGESSNINSMLITGLNGVGKSVYIKSIALCIILAQSGFYVPAESFEFIPYKKLYTRIGTNDNIFKGQSTFYCEMLELEDILRNSDNNSLVIADELCSGSEHYSAQAILASTILEMEKKQTNFLLTTHFHEALELPQIKELKKTGYYHFGVIYDKDTDNIVYDRKIRSGIGKKLYGVEVAQNIIDDKQFMKSCYSIRDQMMDIKKNTFKKSKYNTSLIVQKCEICGSSNELLHTHHINEQHTANKNGVIEHFHKNDLGNLVVLCPKHHDMVHHDNLIIKGWNETQNNGRTLDFEFKKEPKKKNLKYSKDQVQLILDIKTRCGNKTKQAKILLESEKGFNKISIITIKKIWDNIYYKN